MCHFTRQGLGLLLYLRTVKAKSPNSLQLLALTHISIFASGRLQRLISGDWLTSRQSEGLAMAMRNKGVGVAVCINCIKAPIIILLVNV